MPPSLAERLRKAGIRHYDELIHDQKKDWLVKNFKAEGAAPAYPVNVSRLMRNLVWQMKERVSSGEKPLNELVRTYWSIEPAPTDDRSTNKPPLTRRPTGRRGELRRIQETAPLFGVIDKTGGGDGGFQISTEAKRDRLPEKQAITALMFPTGLIELENRHQDWRER